MSEELVNALSSVRGGLRLPTKLAKDLGEYMSENLGIDTQDKLFGLGGDIFFSVLEECSDVKVVLMLAKKWYESKAGEAPAEKDNSKTSVGLADDAVQ